MKTDIEPFYMTSLTGNGFKIEYESHGTYMLTICIGKKTCPILISIDNLEQLEDWLKEALE